MHISLFTDYGALNSGPVFEAFEKGCRKNKIKVTQNKLTADVAVIWSQLWAGRMSRNKDVWDQFVSTGRTVIVIEVGMLRRGVTWKLGVNGVNGLAYWGEGFDDQRFRKLNLTLHPWRQGSNIIISTQRSDSHQWAGMPSTENWIDNTVNEIKKYSDRPIIIRPHPRQPLKLNSNYKLLLPKKLQGTYDEYDFYQQLQNAWCVVNYNSAPGSQAIIHGVPAFVDSSSLAAPVANLSLAEIEKPLMPERQKWLSDISHTEWTTGELATGEPLARILSKLKTN